MAVCIAGMHRSGTSMVARLLNLSGLYLGRDEDMLPAGPANSEGHWEYEPIVEVNEELLAMLGGGWDLPPDAAALRDLNTVARLEHKARDVLRPFAGRELWGWKDPRNSVTLPFWRPLVGTMHVVVCVRHPLEVALSLRRRNGSSIAFGLALWAAYNEALMLYTTPEERLVTHYARCLANPVTEVQRLGAKIGLALSGAQEMRVRESVNHELRHNRFTVADLTLVGVSRRITRLYHLLCDEAGMGGDDSSTGTQSHGTTDSGVDTHPGTAGDHMLGRFDYVAMEALRQRQ